MFFLVCACILANPLVERIVTVQDHDIVSQKVILCEIMHFGHLHNSLVSMLIHQVNLDKTNIAVVAWDMHKYLNAQTWYWKEQHQEHCRALEFHKNAIDLHHL